MLPRREQGASFKAEASGRITGRVGLCSATPGPGAINLLLGVATTNSSPVVARSAQVGAHCRFDAIREVCRVSAAAEMLPTRPGGLAADTVSDDHLPRRLITCPVDRAANPETLS